MISIKNCLFCGRLIRSEVEAVCSEICRNSGIAMYEGVLNQAPICAKNRSSNNPRKLREDIATQFAALIEKLKNAPSINQ
jgi:hypothetical protein